MSINLINYALAKKDWEKAYEDLKVLGVGGRNYFRPSLVNNLAWISTDGGRIEQGRDWRGYYIQVKPGEVFSISRDSLSNNRFGVYFTEIEPAPGVTTLPTFYRDDNALKIEGMKVPDGANYLFVYLSNQADDIPKIKLEKGNKATDWTPAPEDIDAHPFVAELAETVFRSKQNEERIRNLENAITALGGGS